MKWLIALLLAAALYPVFVVYRQSLGHHRPMTRTPTAWGAAYEDIAYRTDDGVTLRGWWVPAASDRAVLLLHGKGGDRDGEDSGIFELGRRYRQAGYTVMLVDMRAHGESGGRLVGFGIRERDDLLGWLEAVDPGHRYRWVVHGFSMGAVTALMMKEKAPDRIGAVVADAPWIDFAHLVRRELWKRAYLPDWSYPYIRWVARTLYGIDFDEADNRHRVGALCGREVLYIFEKEDALLDAAHLRALRRACPSAEVRTMAGDHIEAFRSDPEGYVSEVFAWLSSKGGLR